MVSNIYHVEGKADQFIFKKILFIYNINKIYDMYTSTQFLFL